MSIMEGIARHLARSGMLVSLRLGPCGQWKCRLYDQEGKKQWEALADTAARALTLALRQVDYGRG